MPPTAIMIDAVSPSHPPQLSVWQIAAGRIEDAASQLEQANDLEAAPDTRLLLGMVARQQQDYPAAEALFRSILVELPVQRDVLDQLAIVLAAQPGDQKRSQALQLVSTETTPCSLETRARCCSISDAYRRPKTRCAGR